MDDVIERWTITSAYTERDSGDPDCPNYRVGATVKGPEQREPIEVVPASALEGAVGALERLIAQAAPRSRGLGDAISATFALELAREALSHLRGQS